MRLTVSDPAAIPALIDALEGAQCLAAPDGPDGIAVGFPWVRQTAEARQARVELAFFARAWESSHPGLEVRLALSAA